MTRWIKNILLVSVSFGVFAYLLYRVDLSALGTLLQKSNGIYIALGFFIALIQFGVTSYRWSLLLAIQKIIVPYWRLLENVMIGSFISNLFPSKYAGDVYRAYVIGKYSGKNYNAAASVLMGRLVGLTFLATMGIVATIMGFSWLNDFVLALGVIALCVTVLLGISAVFSETLFSWFDRLLGWIRLDFIRNPLSKFHSAVVVYRKSPKAMIPVFAVSFVFYVNAVLLVYSSSLAIGQPLPLSFIALILPIVAIVEALPISVSGLGIREGVFVFFLMKYGMAYESALAISLINLFYSLASNGLAGILFVVRHIDLKKIEAETQKSPA